MGWDARSMMMMMMMVVGRRGVEFWAFGVGMVEMVG